MAATVCRVMPIFPASPDGVISPCSKCGRRTGCDHLRLIPRQVARIVMDAPHMLDTHDNFVAAAFGPQ